MSGKKQNKLASLFTSSAKEPPAVAQQLPQQPQSISQTPQDYYSNQPALTQRHPSTSSTTDTFQHQYESAISQEDLDNAIRTLENVLKSMDAVREASLRQTAALRAHAESLREYAVGVNMRSTSNPDGSDKGSGRQGKERPTVGEDKVFEKILVHSAGFYDRLAESQEKLGKFYLQEYNSLNSLSSQHFRSLATASGETAQTLRSLSSKISKLTVVPGTANTQNASGPGVVGVHENYVQKLGMISKEMKKVRTMHLKEWGGKTKGIDRRVGRGELNICKEIYSSLADSIARCGAADGMQGLNTWGAFVVNEVSPPIREPDLGLRGEKEVAMPSMHHSDPEDVLNLASNDFNSNQSVPGLWPTQQHSGSVNNPNPSYETGKHLYEPNPAPYMMEPISGDEDYVEDNIHQGSKNIISPPRPPSDYSHFSSLINETRDQPSPGRINIQMMGSITGPRPSRQVSRGGGNYPEQIEGGLYSQQLAQQAPPIPSQAFFDQEAQGGRRNFGPQGIGYGYAEDPSGSNPNLQQVRTPPTLRPTASSSILQGIASQGAASGNYSPIGIVEQDRDRRPLPPATANREGMDELSLLRDGSRKLEEDLKRGSKTSYGGIGMGPYLLGGPRGISIAERDAQRAVSEPLQNEGNQVRLNRQDSRRQPVKRVDEVDMKTVEMERKLKVELGQRSLNANVVTPKAGATPSVVVADNPVGSYFPPQKSPPISSHAGNVNAGDGSSQFMLNAMEPNVPFGPNMTLRHHPNISMETIGGSENKHLHGQLPDLPSPQSIQAEQSAYFSSSNPLHNFPASPKFSPPVPVVSPGPQRSNQGQDMGLLLSVNSQLRLSTPDEQNSTDNIVLQRSSSHGRGSSSPSPYHHTPLGPRTDTQNASTSTSDNPDQTRTLADVSSTYPDLSSSEKSNIGHPPVGVSGTYARGYIGPPDQQAFVSGEIHATPSPFEERSPSARITQQSTQKDAPPHSSHYGHIPSLSMQFFGSKSPSPPMTTQSTVTELQGHGYITSRTPQYSSRKLVPEAYTTSEIGIVGDEHSDIGFVEEPQDEKSIYFDARERQSRKNSSGNPQETLPRIKKAENFG